MKDFNNQIKSAGRRAGSRGAESAGRGSFGMGTLEGFGEERKPRAPRTRRSFGSEEGREERKSRTPRSAGAPRTRRSFGSDEGREERTTRAPRTRRTFDQQEREFTPKTRNSRAASASRVTKTSTVSKASKAQKADDGLVRLNKFIANSGICSRREADEYIAAGLVTVNGETVTELGTKVSYSDDIRFNGERLRGEEKVYIVMNKPKDFVTTVSDPHAENTVVQLVANKCKERVYPVGRLDKSTTGVLLLTNDGELAEQLTHPSYQKKKIYQVTLDKNLKGNDFAQLMEGITLEDGPIAADDLQYTCDDKSVVGIEIHSGRNRIVRRMFESLGYKVRKLDRVYFAGLTKKNLRRGAWRFLTEQEVAMLKMNSYN